MELKDENYQVTYDASKALVFCKGSFMLSGSEEYGPILDLLIAAAEDQGDKLTLDLRELEFLNSSGINTLTKFVISLRSKANLKLSVCGLESIPWQVRLLKNLQRLLPSLTIQCN